MLIRKVAVARVPRTPGALISPAVPLLGGLLITAPPAGKRVVARRVVARVLLGAPRARRAAPGPRPAPAIRSHPRRAARRPGARAAGGGGLVRRPAPVPRPPGATPHRVALLPAGRGPRHGRRGGGGRPPIHLRLSLPALRHPCVRA